MGTTYSNCQVRSDSQEAVVEALRGLLKELAYVAPAANGWVGVYPEGDSDSAAKAEKLAKKLSAKLACGVFFWSVYDSDIFFYSLYEDGKLRDEFDSNPDYFDPVSNAKKARLRGKPEALIPYCVPGTALSAIQEILHPTELDAAAGDTSAQLSGFPDTGFQKLAGMLGITSDALKQSVAQKLREKYVFAEQQANDLAKLLGLDEYLAQSEYGEIDEGEMEDYPKDAFRLVGNESLSQEYKNQKIWKSFRIEDLKSAVKMGADVNVRDNQGVPLLTKVANHGSSEQIQFLIDAGADVNAATRHDPNNPHYALHVQLGASFEDGVTPLMVVAGASIEHPPYQPEAIQVLLNAGADVNARSETGRTALSEALEMTDWKKHQGKIGRRAPEEVLRHAAERSAQVVEILRAAGATE